MTSAFVVSSGGVGAPPLSADLATVGIDVVGTADVATMVPDVIRGAPDLVVCYESHPDDALFAGTAAIRNAAPRPVVVFTSDPDADKIERATRSGIHCYVINGYGLHRLRSVLQVAQARFRHDQLLRDELSDVQHRFNERKLVDRAKGILMRVRNIGEDEAYRVLRSAAMQTKQRIGQVAQQVIDASRYAEAVNRAGQLRMLSQRLVKLYALACAGVTPEVTASLCRDSIEQIEANLGVLGRTLSKPTFGDLIEAVLAPWGQLKAALARAPAVAQLAAIDALAERLLTQAEALTRTLETAGFAAALHVINVSGRQRMLAQRLAKLAIVESLAPARASRDAMTAAETAFLDGLTYLEKIPLTSPEIKAALDAAMTDWMLFRPALARAGDASARSEIASLSEALLTHFERLTDLYERGMQMLME
ncbi:MAG: type IV pili methyl-accepting chemotaxis transducer N-terminal domain-containing protein [Beijerinckiaceae bacterium]|nr:type IV pili methyl-accepting chemotaxis transducer N-terminal domain-containing protein [Beijerinckiaceae bacterium]